MADVDFDEFEGDYASPATGRASRLVHLAGAACSVALIVGMAVWGYKLAVRDVSGIPVVRALAGPMRIAPENPGGEEAMHQGLSVNAIAAAGTVSPLPEKLILAPAEMDLAADDAAGLARNDLTAAAATPANSPVAPVAALSAPATAEPPAAADSVSQIAAPAAIANVPVPQPTAPASEDDAVAAALASALSAQSAGGSSDSAAGIGAAITKTPRPQARPVELQVAATTVNGAAAVPAPTELDPTAIAVGAKLVQLGAFDDELSARAEWTKLQGNFPDLIPTKAMVIQPAESGGRTFYRLRADGFKDEDESRRFCAALLAENASCIPVTQR